MSNDVQPLPNRSRFSLESITVDPVINSKELVYDSGAGAAARAVVNSAGMPFASTVQYQSVDLMITIVRKEAGFDPMTISEYSGKINSSACVIAGIPIARGTAIMFISSEELLGEDFRVWSVTYKVHVSNNWVEGQNIGWKVAVLDCGFQHWKNSTDAEGKDPKKLARALDEVMEVNAAGEYVSKIPKKLQPSACPVLLDGAGQRLGSGVKPVYLVFQPYPEANFGDLNLSRGRRNNANRGLPPVPQRRNDEQDFTIVSTTTTSSSTTSSSTTTTGA